MKIKSALAVLLVIALGGYAAVGGCAALVGSANGEPIKCSVIGAGKLGTPLALVLAKHFPTIAVDINPTIVDLINQRKSPIQEPGVQALLNNTTLTATTNIAAAIAKSNVTFIIVPTPSDANGEFSNRYVLNALKDIGAAIKHKQDYHLIVITSTVMPKSTRGIIAETLQNASGRSLSDNLGLIYSPEFIALGDVVNGIEKPDLVLIGEPQPKSKEGDIIAALYRKVCQNKPKIERTSLETAEITKIAINNFLTMKITFANIVGEACEMVPNANATDVSRIMGQDSRISPKYLQAGQSFGGPCFPRDTAAFRRFLEGIGVGSDLAVATHDLNKLHVDHLVNKISRYVNKGEQIGLLGLSYKPLTDVTDESGGIALATGLARKEIKVSAYDPLVKDRVDNKFKQSGAKLATDLKQCLANSDILVITTAHKEFKELKDLAKSEAKFPQLVFDLCNMFKPGELGSAKIVHLGEYDPKLTAATSTSRG